MLLACLAVWFGTFIFLTFSRKDLPLIGLLLIAIAAFFISFAASQTTVDTIILLAGVTLGKGARVLLRLKAKGQRLNEDIKTGKRKAESENLQKPESRNQESEVGGGNMPEFSIQHSAFSIFLIGLVVLLAFSSWWHLNIAHYFYHGLRWTGLWENPNIYGMLMGAGLTLAIGLLAQNLKSEKLKAEIEEKRAETGKLKPETNQKTESRKQKLLIGFLLVGVFMMGVGLVMSYSRGAWVGTAVGLLYLAKAHGKFKWRWVLPPVLVALVVICFFWNNTPENAPWFEKRLDLSRASAQHRVAAWRGAFQMMRDHPFGVGWNKAVETYEKNYSPPEGGAAAITTNDYLMLGTQLGLPGLLCFLAYVGLAMKGESRKQKAEIPSPATRHLSLQAACRAGALSMLVAFWFDGGLFTLATASVFWILLELSQMRNAECGARNHQTRTAERGMQNTNRNSELRTPNSELGFTLIELLVVIGIIGILAGLLLPVLARAKERAKGTQCLSNLGQMQIAWNIYADDHQGTLPVNGSGSSAGQYADEPSWVAGYLSTGASPDNTNITMLVGQQYQKWGSIGGYTKNPDIYHCPSDLSRDKGNGLARVRSISMNSWINPGRNGEVSGRFWDLNFEKYTQITDFVRLSPSDGFVFLDERPDSINDGWFMVSMESYNPNDLAGLEVRDLPAIYHNRASSFTFADGHAEFHRWLDGRTLAMKFVKAGQPAPNNQDVFWLMQHATRPK